MFVATVTEIIQLNLKHASSLIPRLNNKKKESNEDIVQSEIDISVDQSPKKEETDTEEKTGRIKKTSYNLKISLILSHTVKLNKKLRFKK